jgi:hypothetical protein
MKILPALLLVLSSSVALADYPVQGIPCDAATNGSKLIIERPPTAAEIAAEPPGIPGFEQPPLQMVYDHISCDGTAWKLDSMVKRRRGVNL